MCRVKGIAMLAVRRALWQLSVISIGLLLNSQIVLAQSSVASTSIRPFVTGQIPIVGRGGVVGGVLIDAAGVVERGDVETLGLLRETRSRSLARIGDNLKATSPLRKISLRGIAAEIDRLRRESKPVPAELQFLAGLQRVQYVLAYPEHGDIVLAGFAEGWKIDQSGNVVGITTGHPVLQLDDLLVALRTAKNAATQTGITCSIDPHKDGAQRLQKLLATRGLQMNAATVVRLEEALGPQQITVTGVPPGSHFAYVLVAADFMLKRLGMNLEPAPIRDLPSYLELLQQTESSVSRNAMPRFWLAPNYDPLLKDSEGLAWQLRGPGVKALAENGTLATNGVQSVSRSKKHSLADQWADAMTAKYEELSAALPVFQELRNCMDLAVVAALLVKEDLPAKAKCDLSLLLGEEKVKVAQFHVPQSVASRASLVPKGRQWIVAISGGVEVDSWPVLERVEVLPTLSASRKQAAPTDGRRWWWD